MGNRVRRHAEPQSSRPKLLAGAPNTQLGVVPVTCQSELFLAGHINLNNEKSPRVGVEVGD